MLWNAKAHSFVSFFLFSHWFFFLLVFFLLLSQQSNCNNNILSHFRVLRAKRGVRSLSDYLPIYCIFPFVVTAHFVKIGFLTSQQQKQRWRRQRQQHHHQRKYQHRATAYTCIVSITLKTFARTHSFYLGVRCACWFRWGIAATAAAAA